MTSKRSSRQEPSTITFGKLIFLIPALGALLVVVSDYWRVRSEVGNLQQEVQNIRKQIETQKVK
jgi:cell division protein FtsL